MWKVFDMASSRRVIYGKKKFGKGGEGLWIHGGRDLYGEKTLVEGRRGLAMRDG